MASQWVVSYLSLFPPPCLRSPWSCFPAAGDTYALRSWCWDMVTTGESGGTNPFHFAQDFLVSVMNVLGKPGWLVRRVWESSQHLSQSDWEGRGWEGVEWFEIIAELSQVWFFKALYCWGNVLAYVLLKGANQGKWWALLGSGSMCPIGSCSRLSPNLF